MMETKRHFILTDEFKINEKGVKLFRIKCTKKIPGISIGEQGGFVQSYENLSDNAWVGYDAEVWGGALVSGYAQVYGDARVYDNAEVFGIAEVYGNAIISGKAKVFGIAEVFDNARVFDNAEVKGDAKVYDEDVY